MNPNPVKRRLLDGQVSIGTFLFEFSTTGIARIAAEAGAEFLLIDMEHTGWSIETVRMLIATCGMTPAVPLVRIPATEYDFIARILDVGGAGIMVPMVSTADQAREIVDCAKYPPQGRRGAAFGVSHDNFTGGDIVEKMESANRETLLIALIETVEGVRNVHEIAAVDGIDVLWLGHFDLTNSMGIPGQFDHPDFLAAIDEILSACRAHHCIPAFMPADAEQGRVFMDRGFRMIACGGDLWLYQTALRNSINALRSHAEG